MLANFAEQSYQIWKGFFEKKKFLSEIFILYDNSNYSHESGIPENWNGRVYGMAVDPLVIIIAIFLYIMGAIAVTPVIFLTFILKAFPIFLETFVQFWKNISVMTAVTWYIKVLTGTHESSSSTVI